MKGCAEALICNAQEKAIRTNNTKFYIDKTTDSPLCRMCGERSETVSHIVSECSKLPQKEYKRRHDNVAKYIHWKLCKKYILIQKQQYPTKVLGHFALFAVCNKLSFPSPPETMLVFWRSTCDNGKISRARQLQMYQKRINIVLGGRGVHVCSNYDNM